MKQNLQIGRILTSLLLTLFAATAWADEVELQNADFSLSNPIDNHLCGYGKDMAANGTTYYGLQDIDEWTKVVVTGDNKTADYPNSGMGGAVFPYGSDYEMRGNKKTAPYGDPDGNDGNGLGFFAVWGCGGYYYQDVTLLSGKYKFSVVIYNQSGTQANTSYTGVFVKDSDTKHTVAVNPSVGSWTTETVEFVISEETECEVRVGYLSTGGGSGANPMIFIDNVKLEKVGEAEEYPKDMTAYIVNPTINGSDGWTCEKPNGGNGPLLNGSAFEYWNGTAANGAFDYYQTITGLPDGKYTVSAEMYNSTNGVADAVFSATSGVYGVAGAAEASAAVDVDGTTLNKYTTPEIAVVDGTLRIGVKNFTTMTARWFVADNFTLTLTAALNLDDYKTILSEAITAASALATTIPTAAATALQTVIDQYKDASYETADEYKTAIAAVNAAVTTASAFVTPYAEWTTIKAYATENCSDYGAMNTLVAAYDEKVEAAEAASDIDAMVDTISDGVVAYFDYTKTYPIAVAMSANPTPLADISVQALPDSVIALNINMYNAAYANFTTDATENLGEWTNAPGTNKGQSWDGTADDPYYDLYNNADVKVMTQSVVLPKGMYVLLAKGRASAAASLEMTDGTTSITFPTKGDTGVGIQTDGTPYFAADGTYANNGVGRGWEYRFIVFQSDGVTATDLTFNWTTANAQWAGLDDITLLMNPAYTSTFDFQNNNMGLTIGDADNLNAGDMAGKPVTMGEVTLEVADPEGAKTPSRYFYVASKGNTLTLFKNATMKLTASEGRAVKKVNITFQNKQNGLDVNTGTYETGVWEGNVTAVTFTAPGTRYIYNVEVITEDADEETAYNDDLLKPRAITLDGEIANATIDVAEEALPNATVTVTITPNEGYQLESSEISVATASGEAVEVTDGTFTMPAEAVTVTVSGTATIIPIYIETDLTASFSALTVNTNWKTGAGGTAGYTATEFCPAVTTNAGQTVQVCEFYEASCEREGDLLYQTVTGLAPGTYNIELYGGAAYTYGRGFESEAFSKGDWKDGDKIEPSDEVSTGVVLYAKTSEGQYGGEIPMYYACNFPEGAATVKVDNVVVGENGEVTIGMTKTSKSTNWHVVQLKGVTARVLAKDLLASSVAKANALENKVPEAVFSSLQETVALYNKEYTTAEDYTVAIAAIDAATLSAEAYVEPYAAWKESSAIAETIGVETADISEMSADELASAALNNYVDIYNFTKENLTEATSSLGEWTGAPGTNKGQSWDGTADDTYYDSWNTAPFAMTQDVTLPAGQYVLIVKARASALAGINMTDGTTTVALPVKGAAGYGIETDGTPNYSADGTYANGGAGWGWEYRFLPFYSDGTTATTLTFNWDCQSAQWVGVDDIELYRAYVEVADVEATTDGAFDSEGDVKVAVTYTPTATGSFASHYLDAIFAYSVTDAAGAVVASGEKNPTDFADGTLNIFVSGLTTGAKYTINLTSVNVLDYNLMDYETFIAPSVYSATDIATATFTAGGAAEPKEIALAVERYTGMGYTATVATVDFTEAMEYLGVEELTTDMLRIINPDGTVISDYATYDGWFNGEGVATTWGDNTKICVKFFEALSEGKYSICDMNGADVVDASYTVTWALVANDKQVTFPITVTFVEAPEFKPEVIKTIDIAAYAAAKTAYGTATATFDPTAVATALGLESIADADQYIVNVTDGSFVVNTTDGWRDANGDAATWGSGEGMVCVKIQNPTSGSVDYIGAIDDSYEVGDTYTAKWGFVNAEQKAVVINVNITFVDPTGINAVETEGVKADGKYLEDGKVVIYRDGIKYNAEGQPIR